MAVFPCGLGGVDHDPVGLMLRHFITEVLDQVRAMAQS
jgi:hypothetical protein